MRQSAVSTSSCGVSLAHQTAQRMSLQDSYSLLGGCYKIKETISLHFMRTYDQGMRSHTAPLRAAAIVPSCLCWPQICLLSQ